MAILKLILVVVLIAGMMIILLSIGHLSSGTFHHDADSIDDYRREVDEEESVIGKSSAFRSLVKVHDETSRRTSK